MASDSLNETPARKLRDEGLGIIFVTHFLDQVYELTDRITVLRNGQLVSEYLTRDCPRIELIAHMLGKSVDDVEQVGATPATADVEADLAEGDLFLEARQLGRRAAVEPLDLGYPTGEVVGLAGLLGAGGTETARLLFGADRRDAGLVPMGYCFVPFRDGHIRDF